MGPELICSVGSPLKRDPPLPTTTWAALYGDSTKCSIGLCHAGVPVLWPHPQKPEPLRASWQRTK